MSKIARLISNLIRNKNWWIGLKLINWVNFNFLPKIMGSSAVPHLNYKVKQRASDWLVIGKLFPAISVFGKN